MDLPFARVLSWAKFAVEIVGKSLWRDKMEIDCYIVNELNNESENIQLKFQVYLRMKFETYLDWKTGSSRVGVVEMLRVVQPPSIPVTSCWDQLQLSSKKPRNFSGSVEKTTTTADVVENDSLAFGSCLNLNLSRLTR